MTLEAKKEAALKFIKGMPTCDFDTSMLTKSFRAWSPLIDMSAEEFLAIAGKVSSLFKPGMEIKILGITAEGDRVAIEGQAVGEFVNGVPYRNRYHFLFKFEGEQISEMREYMDSKHVTETMLPLLGPV